MTDKSIQTQLEKILTSSIFLSTELLSRFLRFIVDQALAGRSDWLKESVLGVEIFGRGGAFDPRIDPVVRVDARRLRTKLAEYYQGPGRFDPVIIALPKGGYVPMFTANEAAEPRPLSRAGHPPKNSIAVLPFVNLSEFADFEYFSDGLTEEITASLARLQGFHVAARSASYHFRGKAQNLREVSEALHVRLILEGNVRRAGNRVRMGAQLIDSESCFHCWSETWERELTDVFGVQREIAAAIAERISRPL